MDELAYSGGLFLETLKKAPTLSRYFLLAACSIFFTVYYFQAVHPYIKDIRRQNIEVILTTTGVYKTPFFEDYYLETPLKSES